MHFTSLLFFFYLHCFALSPSQLEKIKSEQPTAQQLILVELKPNSVFKAQVSAYLYQKEKWLPQAIQFKAVLGMKGLIESQLKKEGDKKTPKGLYSFGKLFGRDKVFSGEWPYQQLQPDDKWIDDVNSTQYNQFVQGETKAKSFEKLFRSDHIYDLLLPINYNTNPSISGKGSAIFFHIWRAEEKGTMGCVAAEKNNLEKLLVWLKPSLNPVILIDEQKTPVGTQQ